LRNGRGKLYDLGMGGDEEHAAFFFFLVSALVFGGFDFLMGKTEGEFVRLRSFVYFYEGVLRGETIRGGIAIADGQFRYVVTSKSSR
jgi:hypothetical protein